MQPAHSRLSARPGIKITGTGHPFTVEEMDRVLRLPAAFTPAERKAFASGPPDAFAKKMNGSAVFPLPGTSLNALMREFSHSEQKPVLELKPELHAEDWVHRENEAAWIRVDPPGTEGDRLASARELTVLYILQYWLGNMELLTSATTDVTSEGLIICVRMLHGAVTYVPVSLSTAKHFRRLYVSSAAPRS